MPLLPRWADALSRQAPHLAFSVFDAMANPADLFNGKQLYIAHLAARIEAMERTPRRLNAFSYRLWTRRLREAMAGCPEPLLARGLAVSHPSVAQALEQRFFNTHGMLPGPSGPAARKAADRLLKRLRLRMR